MDPIRRGALVRGGKMLAGAGATMATLGGQGRGQNFAINEGMAKQQALASMDKYIGKADARDYPTAPSVDPHWQARENATRPVYEKLQALEKSRRWKISENAYLEGLKSPSQHWKHSVMLDREHRRQSAVETLQEQLRKLSESPLEKLEQLANEALGAFMAELEKP